MQKLGQHIFVALLMAFWGLISSGCKPALRPDLCETDQLLWDSIQLAQERLAEIDTTELDSLNMMYYQLIAEHIRLKTHMFINPESLHDMITYFKKCHQLYLAGEALYVQGTELIGLARPYEAIYSLIRARHLLQEADSTSFLLGMTYYRIGTVYEQDKLYASAFDAYEHALSLVRRYPYPRYTACLFRDMARTINSDKTDIDGDSLRYIQQAWIDSAFHYISKTHDNELYGNIEYYNRHINTPSAISPDYLPSLRILLNDYPHRGYAKLLADYYISARQADSAYYYLERFATDTIASPWKVWYTELYHETHSAYFVLIGDYKNAYEEIAQMYYNYREQIRESSSIRTDVIANQYEVQEERDNRNRLIIEHQQMQLILISICSVLLFLIGALIMIIRYHKDKQKQLETELQNKLSILREQLLQKVQTVKQLRLLAVRHKLSDEHIQIIESLNQELLAPQSAQLKSWTDSFNIATNNLLPRLKDEHPQLTATDFQVIIFIALNIPTSDVCLLLQSSKETLWRRRNRIKQHLGLSENDDLDEWIRKTVN